jgi:membrane protein implicated in regulation of membrane protease activity
MDTDFTAVVGWIVGIVVVIEFFHIGYLVSAIRKQATKQTKLLLASTGCLVGKDGDMLTYPLRETWGRVRVLGEDWDCVTTEHIPTGAKVKVKAVDGILLMVAAVK